MQDQDYGLKVPDCFLGKSEGEDQALDLLSSEWINIK